MSTDVSYPSWWLDGPRTSTFDPVAASCSGGAGHVFEHGIDPVGTVEEGRHEAADDAQVELAVVPELGRVRRQVAVGPELRRGEAALDHLPHDPVSPIR